MNTILSVLIPGSLLKWRSSAPLGFWNSCHATFLFWYWWHPEAICLFLGLSVYFLHFSGFGAHCVWISSGVSLSSYISHMMILNMHLVYTGSSYRYTSQLYPIHLSVRRLSIYYKNSDFPEERYKTKRRPVYIYWMFLSSCSPLGVLYNKSLSGSLISLFFFPFLISCLPLGVLLCPASALSCPFWSNILNEECTVL